MVTSRRLLGAISIALVLFAFPPPLRAAESMDEVIRKLAVQLANNPGLKKKRIGVVEFTADGGMRMTMLGSNLAERLEAALSRLAGPQDFEIVDRRGLENVKKEWSLWTTDLVKASEAQHLGNLAGLNVLVLGSLVEYADRMQLTIRPIEASSGKNLGAEEAAIIKDATVKDLFSRTVPSVARPAPVTPPSSSSASSPPPAAILNGIKVDVWTDQPSYEVGESILFHFKTTRDAYVTLINISTSGSMSVIFPNGFAKNNFVKAGQIVSVPDDSDKYGFVVHGTPGTEIIRVLATEMPFDWGLHNLPSAPGPFATFTKKEVVVRASSEISTQKAKLDPAKLADAVLKFEVR